MRKVDAIVMGADPKPAPDRRLRLVRRPHRVRGALLAEIPVFLVPVGRLSRTMRVLLVGSGGREHALAWGLSRSPLLTELHAAARQSRDRRPGDAARRSVSDLEQITELAERVAADLVVVGPEAPLVAGLGDRLAEAGIAGSAPAGAAAQIEGSKLFRQER